MLVAFFKLHKSDDLAVTPWLLQAEIRGARREGGAHIIRKTTSCFLMRPCLRLRICSVCCTWPASEHLAAKGLAIKRLTRREPLPSAAHTTDCNPQLAALQAQPR